MEQSMDELGWDLDTSRAMIGDEPANGDVVARTADGRLVAVVGFKDGQYHGQSRSYFPDGRLEEEGFYRYGRPVGALRKWYPNGQLREEYLSTEDGTSLLRHRTWREDGTLEHDSNPDAET